MDYKQKRSLGVCVHGKCRNLSQRTLCDFHYDIKMAGQRLWRKTNRDKHNEQAKKYKKAYNSEREKRRMANWYSRIKSQFGWDRDKVNKVLTEQEYVCAICRGPNNLSQNLVLDHNHETNIPREFLCHRCNSTLGFINDDQLLLLAMWRYLEKHKTRVEIR